MNLTTCAVRARVYKQDGTPDEGAVIIATLNRFDIDEGHVGPVETTAVTDADGVAVLDLWPNQRGSTESGYRVRIESAERTLSLLVVVPDELSADLEDIATLPQYPGKPDGQLAVEASIAAIAAAEVSTTQAGIATTAAATATTQAVTATSAADVATTQAGVATDEAAAAASASDTATAQAGVAIDEAAAAASAADTATTQAGIATGAADAATAQAVIATAEAGDAASAAATATAQAGTATTDAATATTQAGIATGAADTATTQAGVATTQAGLAQGFAEDAATSAQQAAADVLGKTLTGLSTADASDVAPVDTVLDAFGKLQAQSSAQQAEIGGKEATGAADAAVTAHEGEIDPHSQYVQKDGAKVLSTEDYTTAEKTKLSGVEAGAQANVVTSVATKTGDVTLDKADVGLPNVDDVSDADKPVSTAQQAAIDAAVDTTAVALPATTGSCTLDLAAASNFQGTLTGDITLEDPLNMAQGQSGVIVITQGATAYEAVFGAKWKFAGGFVPTLTANAGAIDVIAYYVESATRISAVFHGDVK